MVAAKLIKANSNSHNKPCAGIRQVRFLFLFV